MRPLLRILAGVLPIVALAPAAMVLPASSAQAQACGYYVILGCFKSRNEATGRLTALGGPGVGGFAGAHVINTNDYPNFRNGWWCVADGPYATRDEAMSLAWREVVPDAYVKNGC